MRIVLTQIKASAIRISCFFAFLPPQRLPSTLSMFSRHLLNEDQSVQVWVTSTRKLYRTNMEIFFSLSGLVSGFEIAQRAVCKRKKEF